MSSHSEDTPPPPPLSEAPPSYYSRDSLVDPHPSHHLHSPHSSHSSHNVPHFHNPQFEQDNHSLGPSSDNEFPNDRGSRDDPPPPYSPGLGAILSTRSNHHDVNDAPPSYYSLFGQIREAREQSSNNLTFLRRVGQIVLNTVGCTILLLVFMSVPIAILVIGSIFVQDCPLEPFIPIYLIVGGISGIIKNILLIMENIVQRYSEQLSEQVKHSKYIVYVWRTFNLLFNLFMLAWTIAGGYWVYHIYTEVTNSEYSQCRELLYKFGFGIVTSSYILLLLTCVCVCCCAGICLKLNKQRRGREDSLSQSERDSEGESEQEREDEEGPNESSMMEAEDHEGGYQSDDDSMFSDGDFRTNTLMSTLEASHEANGEEFLRRFRHLNSTTPIDSEAFNRGTAILHYNSSPYPARHAGIRQVQHSPIDYSNPNSPSPHTYHPNSRQLGSSNPVPVMSMGIPLDMCGDGLYITTSAEGYSVTEV